jgi:hypothetical protein
VRRLEDAGWDYQAKNRRGLLKTIGLFGDAAFAKIRHRY